jgi:hypothetical protein
MAGSQKDEKLELKIAVVCVVKIKYRQDAFRKLLSYLLKTGTHPALFLHCNKTYICHVSHTGLF